MTPDSFAKAGPGFSTREAARPTRRPTARYVGRATDRYEI